MCINHNELPKQETGNDQQNKQPEIMISDLLTAISENEYPQYILEAIEKVRAWINTALNRVTREDDENTDTFTEFFGDEFDDEEGGIEELFKELKSLAQYADVIPGGNKASNNKEDTIIVSLAPPDYDSGLRAAIDCAAVFHRPHCKRVWLLSDTFIFNEIIKYIPHVDALNEQGITLRFILITPWGWVELPLSEMTVNKRQFLWRTENIKAENKIKRRRKK
mgnify:CR=1 FL=1